MPRDRKTAIKTVEGWMPAKVQDRTLDDAEAGALLLASQAVTDAIHARANAIEIAEKVAKLGLALAPLAL